MLNFHPLICAKASIFSVSQPARLGYMDPFVKVPRLSSRLFLQLLMEENATKKNGQLKFEDKPEEDAHAGVSRARIDYSANRFQLWG